MSRLGQTVKVKGGAGGLPDWVDYGPGLMTWGGAIDIDAVYHTYVNGQYLAQQNPDGSWTFDFQGSVAIWDGVTLPLPTDQWALMYMVPPGWFISDAFFVLPTAGAVTIYLGGTGGAYLTGIIDDHGRFWMPDGTPMSSATVPFAVDGWLMYAIRCHVRQSG